ncbi:MAG: class I SAM-dependent methyltransferase [Acidobacteria bacterium]|nr:class I SAM-dependent methyltransferase [Acidobacteriota bacterium]
MLLTGLALSAALPGWAQQTPTYLAPWVSSPMAVVERMLELAKVKPGETVFDLGSGDGRVLIAAVNKFQAKGMGVELSQRLVKLSEDNIQKEGLEGKIQVIHGNMLDVDVSKADVVTMYLVRDANDMLRPKLERSLRVGARVVSHDFEVRGWKPAYVDKGSGGGKSRPHAIYVYEMPQHSK